MNDDQEYRTGSIVRVPGSSLTVARASLARRGLDLTKQPSEVMIWEADGSEMVYIPAGEFPMGITDEEANRWEEQFGGGLSCMASTPSHRVHLDAFYIARYPVTNAQYARFVQDTGHRVPFVDVDVDIVRLCNWDPKRKIPPLGKEDHPVVLVSWDDAQAYCEWAGLRLPTEAEWVKAACWDVEAGHKRVYPWGDRWDGKKCNSAERVAGHALATYDEWKNWLDVFSPEDGQDTTTPVGSYSPAGDSPYGCADMAGNVAQWVADWVSLYPVGPQVNPTGPASANPIWPRRVSSGSSWCDPFLGARCAVRGTGDPDNRCHNLGFRCARSP